VNYGSELILVQDPFVYFVSQKAFKRSDQREERELRGLKAK